MAISARSRSVAENRSVHEVHEDRPGWRTGTELPSRDHEATPQSRKKCIFRVILKFTAQHPDQYI
jgi:hypothetical protein